MQSCLHFLIVTPFLCALSSTSHPWGGPGLRDQQLIVCSVHVGSLRTEVRWNTGEGPPGETEFKVNLELDSERRVEFG